jgi:hypothetical protein
MLSPSMDAPWRALAILIKLLIYPELLEAAWCVPEALCNFLRILILETELFYVALGST